MGRKIPADGKLLESFRGYCQHPRWRFMIYTTANGIGIFILKYQANLFSSNLSIGNCRMCGNSSAGGSIKLFSAKHPRPWFVFKIQIRVLGVFYYEIVCGMTKFRHTTNSKLLFYLYLKNSAILLSKMRYRANNNLKTIAPKLSTNRVLPKNLRHGQKNTGSDTTACWSNVHRKSCCKSGIPLIVLPGAIVIWWIRQTPF